MTYQSQEEEGGTYQPEVRIMESPDPDKFSNHENHTRVARTKVVLFCFLPKKSTNVSSELFLRANEGKIPIFLKSGRAEIVSTVSIPLILIILRKYITFGSQHPRDQDEGK
jgi:hypothetical protein